jgi:hypothetical protein
MKSPIFLLNKEFKFHQTFLYLLATAIFPTLTSQQGKKQNKI